MPKVDRSPLFVRVRRQKRLQTFEKRRTSNGEHMIRPRYDHNLEIPHHARQFVDAGPQRIQLADYCHRGQFVRPELCLRCVEIRVPARNRRQRGTVVPVQNHLLIVSICDGSLFARRCQRFNGRPDSLALLERLGGQQPSSLEGLVVPHPKPPIVAVRTRSGYSASSTSAIMPPMEYPTMCAF